MIPVLLLLSLAAAPGAPAARPRRLTKEEARPKERGFPFLAYGPAALAEARARHKFIVLHGAAEWCHWCHVMESTTYGDPEVAAELSRRFMVVKADIDAHPEIGERYAEYGWPATVILTPEARELGKYRGFLEPARFLEILKGVGRGSATTGAEESGPPLTLLDDAAVKFLRTLIEAQLGDHYDEALGGWSKGKKVPMAGALIWSLRRGAAGDKEAAKRALYTLDQQAALLDPIWGGLSQYSEGGVWNRPHFEKLLTFQAGGIESYARAYALTREPRFLERAQGLRRFTDRFLRGPDGAFFVSQDADVGAHDPKARFVSGHDYYPLDEKHRLALGLPRVDTAVYPKENGLGVLALLSLWEAAPEPALLDEAQRTADLILSSRRRPAGGFGHAQAGGLLFLGDNATFGRALVALAAVSPPAKQLTYLGAARELAAALQKELASPGGGFFAHSVDKDAVGAFALRRCPFDENVMAARFFTALGKATADPAAKAVAREALRAISTAPALRDQGRWVGDYLLALDEL